MLTSKQRAEFRAQANSLETTLMVGKDGVTEAVVAEADKLLTARELVKGKVLETALMSAREVSDAICEATGADGISCVGSKFVIWRFSEKCQAERNQTGRAKHKEAPKSKADPVGKGVRARRQAARQAREQRNQYFGSGSRESRSNPDSAIEKTVAEFLIRVLRDKQVQERCKWNESAFTAEPSIPPTSAISRRRSRRSRR